MSRAVGYQSLAYLKPSQEYTTITILSEAPTLADINSARTKLSVAQPQAYKTLPGAGAITMTTGEFNTLQPT
ncbi:MAG: hypothetical protein ACRCYA_09350 [Cetobacterium sp.]|uniref:hypothetical protein n=1 Tax=Cetobacterium sp. TaxID=2071632 RepID=UPI003F334C44